MKHFVTSKTKKEGLKMFTKKTGFYVVFILIVSVFFLSPALTQNNDQELTLIKLQQKLRRTGFDLMEFGSPAGGSGIWETVATVQVNAKNQGYVHVLAQGMVIIPDANTVTLSLNDSPASRGPWVYSLGDSTAGRVDNYNSYACSMVFEVPSEGVYTFYLNATSYAGDGSLISVENGVLSATWIDYRQVTYLDLDQRGIGGTTPYNR
jgi:hypothetical protein